jgi:hypothetical protein
MDIKKIIIEHLTAIFYFLSSFIAGYFVTEISFNIHLIASIIFLIYGLWYLYKADEILYYSLMKKYTQKSIKNINLNYTVEDSIKFTIAFTIFIINSITLVFINYR